MAENGQLPLAFRISMAVINVIFALLILIVNGICIIVVAKTKNFKHSNGSFFVSLAIADVCMGCLVLLYPYSIIQGTWPYGDVFCKLSAWWRSALVVISNWHLFFLSLDTFMAVYKPLTHRQLLSFFRCVILVVFTWTALLIVFSLPLFGMGEYEFLRFHGYCSFDSHKSRYFAYIVISCLVPALIAIYVINMKIWCIAKRSSQRSGLLEDGCAQNLPNGQRAKKNWQAFKTVSMILIFFTFTSMVMYAIHLIQSVGKVRLPVYVAVVGSHIALANHWINIFIYTYVNKNIRRTFIRLFCCYKRGRARTEQSSNRIGEAIGENGVRISGRQASSSARVWTSVSERVPPTVVNQSTNL